jgi:phosphotransferase system enzyme I (PtsP)
MMRGGAGLDAHDARRQLLDEPQDISTFELAANDHVPCICSQVFHPKPNSAPETDCRKALSVTAELAERFPGRRTPEDTLRADLAPARLDGMRLNEGIAIGRAVLHQPRVSIRQMVADNPDLELKRLDEALSSMHSAIDDMLASSDMAEGGEHREILESYRMFAEDSGWLGRIGEAIRTGLTAEAAVQRVQDDTRIRMSQISDPYIRERLSDLEDLANRLLRHLTGDRTAARSEMVDDAVLVARSMGPAELLDYDRAKIKGIVLEEGSPTAHVAIVARALGIPMVGRVKDLLTRVEPLDLLVVDGDHAQIVLRPSEDVREAFVTSIAVRAERQASLAALRHLPAVTRDGVDVSLFLNAGLLIDLMHLEETGALGVGLYRTELPFMLRSTFPDVATQADFYGKVLQRAAGKPVVFRTLDIGGDKLLPYQDQSAEENPAMGWRAIRIGLDRPMLLRHQLRALLQATGSGRLDLMFPMVAEVAEFDAARALLDVELERREKRGEKLPSILRIGTMLEVPSLFWQFPTLLKRVDFISVGTNDLMQFLFASDRGNPRLAERYDVLSPPALAFLGEIVRRCNAAAVDVTLCGEMGSRPLEAMALIAIGFRRLSMPASAIAPVKAMTRGLDLAPLRAYLAELCEHPHHSLREYLRSFAKDHDVPI